MPIYLIKQRGSDDTLAALGRPVERWSAEIDQRGNLISMSKLLSPDEVRRLTAGPDQHIPALGWDIDAINESIRSSQPNRFELAGLVTQ